MRILHLADVHLDTPFAGRSPDLRRRLRDASRRAFARAVDAALAEEVLCVVIAGDLFDGATLSFETERFLLDELGRLEAASIPVVYATGNHDPGRDGARAASLHWPSNVTVAPDATPRRVAIRDRDGTVVGHVTAAGHTGPRETRDLAARFPRPEGHRPEIAVLHAQVVGSRDEEAHEPYAPTEVETLRRAGYHYWALGHVHTRQALSGLPAIHYPGNLQGRTHAESGPRGGLLVDVGVDGAAEVEFRAFAPVRWESIEVSDLGDAATLDAVVGAVTRRWRAARAADPAPDAEWMVRVTLAGGTPLWRELASDDERPALARELREAIGALDVEVRADRVHAVVDADMHEGREDVLGVALRRLRELAHGQGALPAGLERELAGLRDDVDARDYVREVLGDAEGEILARMLDPERAR